MKKLTSIFLALLIMISSSNAVFAESDMNAATCEKLSDYLSFDADYVRLQPYCDVAVLRGSWYEMGVQYAEQYPDPIKRVIVGNIKRAIATWGSLEACYEAFPKMEEYVNKVFPEYLEFCAGMAEGLGIAYEDVLVGYCSVGAPEANACMAASAWGEATGGDVYSAHHSDTSNVPLYYCPVLIMYPDKGNALVLSQGINPLGGMNDKGLSVCATQGFVYLPEDSDEGNLVPSMMCTLYPLVRCDNAEEAARTCVEKCVAGTGQIVQIVDASGEGFIVEMTPAHAAVRKTGEQGEASTYLIQANNFRSEEMLSSVPDFYPDCDYRYDSVDKYFRDTLEDGVITLDTIREALGNTSYYDKETDEWKYTWNLAGDESLFSPQNKDITYGCAIRRVMNLSTLTMYVLKGAEYDLVSKVPYSTGAYCAIQYNADVGRMLRAAGYEARYQIWLATQDIEKARENGEDTAARMENINLAREAIYQAENYQAIADATGNEHESLDNYGKALSLFYKAQVLAKTAKNDPASLLN